MRITPFSRFSASLTAIAIGGSIALMSAAGAAAQTHTVKISKDHWDCDMFNACGGLSRTESVAVHRFTGDVFVVWGDPGTDGDSHPGRLAFDHSAEPDTDWGNNSVGFNQHGAISGASVAASWKSPRKVIVTWIASASPRHKLAFDWYDSYDENGQPIWKRTAEEKDELIKIDGSPVFAGTTETPSVATNDRGQVIIVYKKDDTLKYVVSDFVSGPGRWRGPFDLDPPGPGTEQSQPAVEGTEDGFAVAWIESTSGKGSSDQIFFKHLRIPSCLTNLNGYRARCAQSPRSRGVRVSDNPEDRYTQPALSYLPARFNQPGSYWIAFSRGPTGKQHVFVDRSSDDGTDWGTDIKAGKYSVPYDRPSIFATRYANNPGGEVATIGHRRNTGDGWELHVSLAEFDSSRPSRIEIKSDDILISHHGGGLGASQVYLFGEQSPHHLTHHLTTSLRELSGMQGSGRADGAESSSWKNHLAGVYMKWPDNPGQSLITPTIWFADKWVDRK